MTERISALWLAAVTALQVAVAQLTPAPALARRPALGRDRGATMIEYVLLGAVGVAIAILIWTFLMPGADEIIQEIGCYLKKTDQATGCNI